MTNIMSPSLIDAMSHLLLFTFWWWCLNRFCNASWDAEIFNGALISRGYPAKRALSAMRKHGGEGPFGRIPSICLLLHQVFSGVVRIAWGNASCWWCKRTRSSIKSWDRSTTSFKVSVPHCKVPAHDGVIKWKYFPRYWPFVRAIHRSPVNSLYKGQLHAGLMISLICIWINSWVNNGEAGDLRCPHTHYDVTVMTKLTTVHKLWSYFCDHGIPHI